MTPADWYPLLRRLNAAGWEHIVYGPRGHRQHVWRRNENATNRESIESDPDVAAISIGDVSLSAAGLTPDQCYLFLFALGAFDPAPPPVYPAVRLLAGAS